MFLRRPFKFLTSPLTYAPHLKSVKPWMLSRTLIPMLLTSFRLQSKLTGLRLRLLRHGYLEDTQCKFELLHFWGVVISKQLLAHDDTSLPRQVFFFTRFTAADPGHVWMLIKGYINELFGETSIDLRMGLPSQQLSSLVWKWHWLKRNVKMQLMPPASWDRTRVTFRACWRCSLNVSPSSAFTPPRTTPLCGLRHSPLDPWTLGGSTVCIEFPFETRPTLWQLYMNKHVQLLSAFVVSEIITNYVDCTTN
jgi:hypothetical protein